MDNLKTIFGYFKRVIRSWASYYSTRKSIYFNHLFQKRKIGTLLSIYSLENSLRPYKHKLIKVFSSCKNNENGEQFKAHFYNVESVKNHCEFNYFRYRVIEEAQLREVYIPHYCGSKREAEILKLRSPEIYVAELEDVNVIGENSVIIEGNSCLYDIAKLDIEGRCDLRFASTRNIDHKYAIIESINTNETIPIAINLVGFAAFNYYHLTVELLSRMQYIDRFKEYRTIPLLVDEIVLIIPQYKELLNIFNKLGHPVITIKKNHMVKVKMLIFSSYNSWLPINVQKGQLLEPKDFLIAKSAIEYVRNNVLNALGLESEKLYGHRRFFVSRKNSYNMRLDNEEEVIKLFRAYDFVVVYPEELSFGEQVKLFAEAEYVAGATGAAFTNIIYCPRNAKIMCIIPLNYQFHTYSTMAKMIGLQCSFIDAVVVKRKQTISAERYTVDAVSCKASLDTFMSN